MRQYWLSLCSGAILPTDAGLVIITGLITRRVIAA
jgi:hypothetical protein